MCTLTTLLFCAIIAPAINAPNGNYTEIPSTIHLSKNTGQVREKRQYWETTAERQYSHNDNREKQNEQQQNNNEQTSVSYIDYDGSAQNYKPPPPPLRHWGGQDYYRKPPPPPPHDRRYPRRPWPPPPPPERHRSFDHGPPPHNHGPPYRGPPPPDRRRSFDHGPPPPPPYRRHRPPPSPLHDHGPPHQYRGPPPLWDHGPPHRGPPPPGPPHRGPPRHGPPPPHHHGPLGFDRKPPPSYNQNQSFEDKRPPNHGPPPDRIHSSGDNRFENKGLPSTDNIQTNSSNDQNDDFIKNLKLVFSDEFKNTFLKTRQTFSEPNNENPTTVNTPDPGYNQGQGEPLANLEHDTGSVPTTPPSLSYLFQVIPVTPES